MRVAHLHRIGGIGGSERHLLTLLPALRERGVDAWLLGLDDHSLAPEPFYDALAAHDVPFRRVPAPRDLDPRLLARVRRALGRIPSDIVHTHLVHGDVYGALATLGSPAVLVSTKHNDDPFRAGSFRHVERLLTRRASRVVCITSSVARFCADVVGLPDEKLRVVHYGLDAPPDAWGATDTTAVAAGSRVLLAVCRLVEQKGLDVAVRALRTIADEVPAATLVVLGEGPERDRLQRLAAELGVQGYLFLPGRVGNVAAWLRRAELLVHPARWEGFGLALLEAMHASRPIVASGVASIPEIVVDGETGILVPSNDATALADAILALLRDRDRARLLGEAGRRRALDAFSVDRMTARTIAIYEEALASPRQTRRRPSAHDSTE